MYPWEKIGLNFERLLLVTETEALKCAYLGIRKIILLALARFGSNFRKIVF